MAANEREAGSPSGSTGRADFWALFDALYEAVLAELAREAEGRESASLLPLIFGADGAGKQGIKEAFRAAIGGDWAPLSAHFQAIGNQPAARDLPLAEWTDLLSRFENCLLRPTVAAHQAEAGRLVAVLEEKRRFFYGALRLIAEVRVSRREGSIALQREAAARAAEELSRSEARKNVIVDAALDAIVTIDHQSRILEFNPAAESLFGYTRAGVLGKDLSDFFMPARYRGAHKAALAHAVATGHGRILDQRVEMPAVRADGTELLVELTVTRLPSTDPPAYTGFMRDVTEQRTAQEALRSSEARYRKLFEKSPLPTWVADRQTLRFLEVNDAAVAHYGYSREEFLAMTVADIRPAEEVPALLARFGAGIATPDRMVHRKKDGERIDVEVIAHPIEHEQGPARLVIAQNVTARERAEEQLRRSEARFATLYQSGIVGIAVLHLDGAVLEANDAYLRILGYRRDDLAGAGLRWPDLTPPEWKKDDEAAIESMLAQGSAPTREKEYFRKDGTRVPVLIGSALLEKTHFLSFVLDITERKGLEQLARDARDLREENRRILEASRLKSEFLASMSHELRTPLNAIIGFADLLHDEEVAKEASREYLGDILSSARHLLGLINDVLDLAKVEAGKLEFWPEQVACGALVEEVVSVLRPLAAAKQMAIAVAIDPALEGGVFIDPVRLKQVLYNYLSNALKFTPRAGKVAVRMRAEGKEALRLEVEDDGPGIGATDLDRLFVEFQQLESGANRSHEGTGLGLALTRRLVEAQGGSVGVLSQPGRGSIFHAVLPRRAGVAPSKGVGR